MPLASTTRRSVSIASITAAAVLATSPVCAQQYPSKPVRVIVPFAPGGGSDISARRFSAKLTSVLGQQFLVDNRGGAAGLIGMELTAKSPPDGYTIMIMSGSFSATSATQKPAFDPINSIVPIVEFGITPTGYDASGLRPEYTYRNQEALLQLQRDGKTRYFFFINNRLWKIYDAVPFATGTMGKTFADAVNMMNGKLGVRGRILAPEPDKGRTQTHVDWRDNVSHMRLVDRAGEGLTGVALEELTTLGNLGSLRGVKEANPMAIDPTIAAVTGGNRVDPNAAPEKDPSKDPKDPKKAPPKTAPKKK